MQAIVLAAGNSASYHDFFDAGWEYLSQQLSAIGLQPVRGEAIPDSVSDCMSTLRDVIGQYQLVLVLASPQPRTATMLSAVLAKGLGLQLTSSPAAAQAVQNHAQRLSVQLLPQDAAAFATIPDGASTLQNPNGFFQGYAISARRQLLLVLPTSPSELQHLYTTYLDELLQRFADSLRTPAVAKPAAVTAAATRTTATTAHLPGGAVVAPTASAAARPAPPRNRIISQCLGRLNGKTKSTERSSIDMARRTNLIQRLMAGKLTRNDMIRLGAVMVCLCIFVGCILYIASVGQESKDNKKLTDDLKTLFTTGTGTEADIPEKIREKYPKAYLPKFASLYEQNDEIAGWIKLDNSQVDYPVVQTSDNVYYDRLDFTRKSNQHGVPFVDFRTDQRTPSTNTIIYSHNMDDSQMFGELLNYKQLSYYQSHPVITYDSVYMEGKYKVFGIVLCKKDDPEFLYHDFIDKKDDAEMAEYVTKIRERSMINTKVDVRTDDYLLTLSTCDYAFKSNTGEHISRFVIFARKVRPGESVEVDVKGATINTNHIMPPEWYAKLEQQRAAEIKKQEAAQAAQATQKWLYPEELNDLDAEGKKRVIADRKALVEKHLTVEEQSSMTLDEMLSA
ncbi:MAG: sortase, partial [Angelakisella sp.]